MAEAADAGDVGLLDPGRIAAEVVSGIRDSVDCNLYFFGHAVSTGAMYAIMLGSIGALIGLYVLLNRPGHGGKHHG